MSGGGELTNMGCYAIDYMLALYGMPNSVQARKSNFWGHYSAAGVENFGQIVADYGSFYALLNSGKQAIPLAQTDGRRRRLAAPALAQCHGAAVRGP